MIEGGVFDTRRSDSAISHNLSIFWLSVSLYVNDHNRNIKSLDSPFEFCFDSHDFILFRRIQYILKLFTSFCHNRRRYIKCFRNFFVST